MDTLADVPDLAVIALGGRLRPVSQAFVGPLTEAMVQRLTFDRAFLGADAVHAELGICEAGFEQTRLKELLMSRARRTYVLAHAAKLGQSPYHAWAVMPSHWTLITDTDATPAQVAAFRASTPGCTSAARAHAAYATAVVAHMHGGIGMPRPTAAWQDPAYLRMAPLAVTLIGHKLVSLHAWHTRGRRPEPWQVHLRETIDDRPLDTATRTRGRSKRRDD